MPVTTSKWVLIELPKDKEFAYEGKLISSWGELITDIDNFSPMERYCKKKDCEYLVCKIVGSFSFAKPEPPPPVWKFFKA